MQENKLRLPWLQLTIAVALGGSLTAPSAFAQQEDNDGSGISESVLETVVVTGVRANLQRTLEVKRSTTAIADGIFGAEMGDLPDLSVAETLERVTGLTSDRFKGGSSDISIRGLGSFLTASTFNGREISSGSDGRQVNYGQFPSELISGALVYKSQQASLVEGGIGGTIELRTINPIDYDKRRLQVQGLFGYSDYESRVVDGEDVSQRYTGSFINSWDTSIGKVGVSIGAQVRDATAPEDFFTSSSTYRPCNSIGGSNCSFDASDSEPFYLASNQYRYRAIATDADRDSILATFQWQPNDNVDIVLDVQRSNREDIESRADLVIAEGRRGITPLEVSSSGALLAHRGTSRFESETNYRTRDELYESVGLAVEWQGVNLNVKTDISYNKTERNQQELQVRGRNNSRVGYTFDRRGQEVPSFVIDAEDSFDLNDHSLFTNSARARRRLEDNIDEIFATRVDADYEFANEGLFTNLKFGARYSTRDRLGDDGIDCETNRSGDRANCGDNFTIVDGGFNNAAVVATQLDQFPVNGFLSDADTNQGALSWATWDPEALFFAITGGDENAGLFVNGASTSNSADTNISEDVLAAYLQAEFNSELFGKPVYGNVGVRVVNTDITSVGIGGGLVTSDNGDGTLDVGRITDGSLNVETNSFTNVLPSANVVFELNDEMLLRFAAYSAIARPDARNMSAALTFGTDDEFDAGESLGNLISSAGNPQLEPLESFNLDVSWEWYADEDTAFSFAAYYKDLQTGLENQTFQQAVPINGVATPVSLTRQGNSNNSSSLTGFEVSVQHVFSNLPGIWGGFGIQAGYNYADTNFETADPRSVSGNALADFVPNAGIPGASDKTANAVLFWENDSMNFRLSYKTRSEYYKPFRVSSLRYTKAQDFLDFSASFDLTDNLVLRLQALNLLDEPNVFTRPVNDSLAETAYSGTRYFVGLRAKF